MKPNRSSTTNIVPFRPDLSESTGAFVTSRSKILMKTSLHQPISDAYGIHSVDAVRIADFRADVKFSTELRWEQIRQSLICGLLTPDYRKGIAIALDVTSGGIVDVLNGAGPLGYLSTAPLMPGQAISFALQLQKFGRNFIASVSVMGENLTYPAFVSPGEETFYAVVGSDVGSGSSVSHRNSVLHVRQSGQAKVA